MILSGLAVAPTASAQLSPSDSAALTTNLNAISPSSWPPPPATVSAVSAILSRNSRLTVEGWTPYFRGYFSLQPMSRGLYDTLMGSAVAYPGLRGALILTLVENVDSLMSVQGNGLNASMVADPILRDDVAMSFAFVSTLVAWVPDAGSDVYVRYLGLVARYPAIFSASKSATLGYIGMLRRIVWFSLVNARPLTTEVKQELIGALGLTGRHRNTLEMYSTLVCDNGSLSTAQWDIIDNLLSETPPTLSDLGFISVNDFLGVFQLPPLYHFLGLVRGSVNAINISGITPGQAQENSFPADATAKVVDIFSIVLAHELAHVIDNLLARTSTSYSGRHQQLIANAASDSLQYLRSTFAPGFFVQYPQEFLPSMANEWYTDATTVFELGRRRFANGRREPLNQALYLTEVFSQGSDTTLLFAFSTSSMRFNKVVSPVTRDQYGHINSLRLGDSLVTLTLDADGNALAVDLTSVGPVATLAVQPRSTADTLLVGSTASVVRSAAVGFSGPGAAIAPWTASHSTRANWVALESVAGSGPGNVRWRRTASGLSPGTYVDTLVVKAPGSFAAPQSIVDRLVVAPPLSVSATPRSNRDSVAMGASIPIADSSEVVLAGYGSTTAGWRARVRAPWLKLADSAGVGSARIRWSRDPRGVGAGIYVDTISIVVAGASGSPALVVDTLRIYEPVISVECALSEVFGQPCLGPVEKKYLDAIGNVDGRFGLGDVMALLDRKRLPLPGTFRAISRPVVVDSSSRPVRSPAKRP